MNAWQRKTYETQGSWWASTFRSLRKFRWLVQKRKADHKPVHPKTPILLPDLRVKDTSRSTAGVTSPLLRLNKLLLYLLSHDALVQLNALQLEQLQVLDPALGVDAPVKHADEVMRTREDKAGVVRHKDLIKCRHLTIGNGQRGRHAPCDAHPATHTSSWRTMPMQVHARRPCILQQHGLARWGGREGCHFAKQGHLWCAVRWV